MSDLMAWNADATRLPYRMHSQYLRQLFLNNDLFGGRYKVDGKTVALSDIRVPVFMVGTERDHVAPWRSVYKLNLVADTEINFVLTSGGHNAGIVSEPGHPGRYYRTSCRPHAGKYIDPDEWYLATPVIEGSWWQEWVSWLGNKSGGKMIGPPLYGTVDKAWQPLCDAPGKYVLER